MIQITLPDVNQNETLSEYIKRLIETEVIKPSQIFMAIQKFNKK